MTYHISANLAHSAVAGAVSGLGGMALYGNLYVYARGTVIPVSVLLGVGGALGMFASNLAHDYIFPALHITERLSQPITTSLNIGGNAVMQAIVLSLASEDAFRDLDKIKLLGEAAAAVVVSDWLYSKYIAPMMNLEQH
jgi:hypothetical protein